MEVVELAFLHRRVGEHEVVAERVDEGLTFPQELERLREPERWVSIEV